MTHSSLIRFAFCTLLLLSSTNLFAQEAPVAPAADPANPQVYFHLDRMVVKGLTEKDFKIFPSSEHDELTYEKGDKKIPVQYDAYFDYSSVVRQVILCNIQANYDKKFEKDSPTKEELTFAIRKHITERVNNLLTLKREPLAKVVNRLREEINRETALLNESRKIHSNLIRKAGGFSPQAAEELKSKLWIQNLDLQSQIEGNKTMIAGLQKEIERLMKAQSDRSVAGENSEKLENLRRSSREFGMVINSLEKRASPNEEEVTKFTKMKESVERQITELEEKIIQQKLPNESAEMQKKLAVLSTKLSEARNEYRNPRHPIILNLEQQLEALEKEAKQLKSNLLQAALIETFKIDTSALPALQAKLSETRIANDVLTEKQQKISTAVETVWSAADFSINIETHSSAIKEHQRTLDILNEKLLDARTKINELSSQSFELVPLK